MATSFLTASAEYLFNTLPLLAAYSPEARASLQAQVVACLEAFPGLAIQVKRFYANGDSEPSTTPLLALEGTIPVDYRGARYNIPVSVRLPQGAPLVPPACFVVPTPGLLLKPQHANVDIRGRCNLVGHQRNGHQDALKDVVAQMVQVFSAEPPLYAQSRSSAATQAPLGSTPIPPLNAWDPSPLGSEELQLPAAAVQAQLKTVAAQESGCEDAVEEAQQQLADGKLGATEFLRVVRAQGRAEFLAKALRTKLERVLAAVLAREAEDAAARSRAEGERQLQTNALAPLTAASSPVSYSAQAAYQSQPYPGYRGGLVKPDDPSHAPSVSCPVPLARHPYFPTMNPPDQIYPGTQHWSPYTIASTQPVQTTPLTFPSGTTYPPPPDLFRTFLPPPNPYASANQLSDSASQVMQSTSYPGFGSPPWPTSQPR